MKNTLTAEKKLELHAALFGAQLALEDAVSECRRLGHNILADHRAEQKARVEAALAMLDKEFVIVSP